MSQEIAASDQPTAPRDIAGPAGAVGAFFITGAIGYALRGTAPVVAWAIIALVAGLAGLGLHRLRINAANARGAALLLADRERATASYSEAQRQLRHDVRGALSPALLVSDRLIANDDPKVRRAAEIMVKAIERTAALLADPATPANPPGDP